MNTTRSVQEAARLLQDADALIIAAGAGMSVDSGLPDFRGSHGLWTSMLPAGMSERDIGSLTQGDIFRRDPLAAWRFYSRALQACTQTVPHTGYQMLLRWAQSTRHGAFVYTSNVDGHFQRAGFAEERVVECHGSINFMQCSRPCSPAIWSSSDLAASLGDADRLTNAGLPRCGCCGSFSRPNFLMFSDSAWLGARTFAQQLRQEVWRGQVRNPVVVEIGAGLAVPSVRMFAESLRMPLIRINRRDAEIGQGGGVALRGSALEMLSRIDEAVVSQRKS